MKYLDEKINLSGQWRFELDPDDKGISEKWYTKILKDNIVLPGTCDENKKGKYNGESQETGHLTRIYEYTGKAWYQREFEVHDSCKNISIFMERTKVSMVWIDGRYIGTNDSLAAPHIYDIDFNISKGIHTLTVMVDNKIDSPAQNAHQLSDNTQTNWNGILGKIEMLIHDNVYIKRVNVTPDIKNSMAKVHMVINNAADKSVSCIVSLAVSSFNSENVHNADKKQYILSVKTGLNNVDIDYEMGSSFNLWSEFTPALYKLHIDLSEDNGDKCSSSAETVFGMRRFKAEGEHFTINGENVFLRGKHDACVFPLTGYAPMDRDEWIRVLKIAKSYGFNHYRFHTWCPPEAAFAAADIVGMYFQVELPAFSGNYSDGGNPEFLEYLQSEGMRIIDSFSSHPSFVMFSMGNEINASEKQLGEIVRNLRRKNDDILYTEGSNNNFWGPAPFEGDDYWVIMRTEKGGNNIRASFSHADKPLGHVQDDTAASTCVNYEKCMEGFNLPIVSHEIGQYQVYPDFGEMKKYTGVLKPNNFEIFKKRLEDAGMFDEAQKFFKASGALSVLCYKEEIETAMRTRNMAGFQLLDLQDFPGQGTALVGILDAFMDSKGLISENEWRQFCAPYVIMLCFKKYTYVSSEKFAAEVRVSNFGPKDIKDAEICVSLKDSYGNTVDEDGLKNIDIKMGGTYVLGEVTLNLNACSLPQKLTLEAGIKDTDIKNDYDIWVYPENLSMEPQNDIHICSRIDEALNALRNSERVLLMPEDNIKNSVEGFFASDFWCFLMFEGICKGNKCDVAPGTLGILCDPNHNAFESFPTECHSNWQWWSIVMNSRPVILDGTQKDYRPIVQVIDNFERNHKLGLLFEFKVLSGKLLVFSGNLRAHTDKPEVRQFLKSILNYMASDKFNPDTEISIDELKAIIS